MQPRLLIAWGLIALLAVAAIWGLVLARRKRRVRRGLWADRMRRR
jgi:hypothetical protein